MPLNLRQSFARCLALALAACCLSVVAQAQPVAGGIYQLKQGSECIASGAAGAAVTLQTCDAGSASSAQAFGLTAAASGTFVVQSRANGEVFDISGGSASAGAGLITWPGNGQDNQRFAIAERAAGAYELRPQHANTLCLAGQADNSVTLASCNASASEQAWELVEVELPSGDGLRDCTQDELYQPRFVENLQGGPRGSNAVIITGGYMMVLFAVDSGGPPGILHFYDIIDPRLPVLQTRIDDSHTARFREAHSLPVGRVGGREFVAIQTIDGIQFWDLTDPLDATYVSQIDLPGVVGGDYENVAWQADWRGRHLFVAGANQGLYVIDAFDPENPELLEQVPTGQTGGFRVGPLLARGSLLVIANMDQNGAYSVLDISRPAQPALLATLDGLPRLYSITASGNRIYGAGRDGDFTIHSFENPTQITPVSSTRIEQDSLYVAAQDHFVYSGRQENFVKLDVSDEQNVRIVGEGTVGRTNTDHGQVTPMGNWVFIGNDHGTGSAFFCHATTDDLPLATQTVFPSDGSTHQDPESAITIVFSDYVDLTTVDTSTISIRPSGGEPVEGIYTYNFNTLHFSPGVPFAADTTYEIAMPADGVRDVSGNPLAEEVIVRFSTGSDIVIAPPMVVVEPADGARMGDDVVGGMDGAAGASDGLGSAGVGGAPPMSTDTPMTAAPTVDPPQLGEPATDSKGSSGGCGVMPRAASSAGAASLWWLALAAFLMRRRVRR